MKSWMLLLLVGCAAEEDDVGVEEAPAPQIGRVCINELMVRSEIGQDWVELYGEPGEPLEGWSILWGRDDVESFPLDGLALDGAGFLVLVASGSDAPGHLPIQLDGDGEDLGLRAPDHSREWISWTAAASEYALARETDCCVEPDCWIEVLGGTPGDFN